MSERSRRVARLVFLGGQRIEIGSDVVTPEAERLFAMVVRLCVPLGRLTSRQTMMDTLWPGADDANARHNLRQTVYKARELGLLVESGEDGLRLDPRHWSCDWEDPAGDVPGEWLAEYEPEFSEDLRGWVTAQRVGVHAMLRPRIIRSLQRARAAGELVAADGYARQLLGIDELNEEATLTRAELMAMQGSKVDALRLLDTYLKEIGQFGPGKDAGLPAQLLRRRIAEKLPAVRYQTGVHHFGALIGRAAESKCLFAAVIETRAGRGTGTLIEGTVGTGKSRLLHEARTAALLQGMLVIDISCEAGNTNYPFSTLRLLVARLLALPGAMGVAPDAFAAMQLWLTASSRSVDDCPIAAIEDLFASIAEETPLAVLIDEGDRMDSATLSCLDWIYRTGESRQHMTIVAATLLSIARADGIQLRGLRRILLAPMELAETQRLLESYVNETSIRSSPDHIACAAVFSEGVPMYGIEMLGLLRDEASPDVIPWRVQNAIASGLNGLNEVHIRILALCDKLQDCAHPNTLVAATRLPESDVSAAIAMLELAGYLRFENGSLLASPLMALSAQARLRANDARMDALRAGHYIALSWNAQSQAAAFYATIRLFIVAKEEKYASQFLDHHAGELVRIETAQSLVFELMRLRKVAQTQELCAKLESTLGQIAVGSENRRSVRKASSDTPTPTSLPSLSETCIEVEYSFSSDASLNAALAAARDPNALPSQRMTDAVMALAISSNTGEVACLHSAFQAANAVRHSHGVAPFDIGRADLIYYATLGDRAQALRSAETLEHACRGLADIHLACKGLRNAAEVFSTFGDIGRAQALLHESRELAYRLGYSKQIAWADIRLADLSIECMDAEGSRAYLQSASDVMQEHNLTTPLLVVDLQVQLCWQAILIGDHASAAKAAKVVTRRMQRSYTGTGFAHWTALSVKLATQKVTTSRESERAFDSLRESIGSRAYYPNEHVSMAALLIASRKNGRHKNTSELVANETARLESLGRRAWPFLATLM
ncbi:MAG: AAA family ATPase [Gemmatimonadaceae bacterium]|nr:AAA family ATPase [Gemmatimonadaceae bacterium]